MDLSALVPVFRLAISSSRLLSAGRLYFLCCYLFFWVPSSTSSSNWLAFLILLHSRINERDPLHRDTQSLKAPRGRFFRFAINRATHIAVYISPALFFFSSHFVPLVSLTGNSDQWRRVRIKRKRRCSCIPPTSAVRSFFSEIK